MYVLAVSWGVGMYNDILIGLAVGAVALLLLLAIKLR